MPETIVLDFWQLQHSFLPHLSCSVITLLSPSAQRPLCSQSQRRANTASGRRFPLISRDCSACRVRPSVRLYGRGTAGYLCQEMHLKKPESGLDHSLGSSRLMSTKWRLRYFSSSIHFRCEVTRIKLWGFPHQLYVKTYKFIPWTPQSVWLKSGEHYPSFPFKIFRSI